MIYTIGDHVISIVGLECAVHMQPAATIHVID